MSKAAATDRLCIICNTIKPSSQFERKGEHIVPRFMGNRRLRTPFVCGSCNGALGGTVDVALKSAPGVAAACFNRSAGWARSDQSIGQSIRYNSLFAEYYDNTGDQSINKNNHQDAATLDTPSIKSAILKIAYESAHLRIGDPYLTDPTAATIREILFAFVNKDKEKALGLIDDIPVRPIDINAFHAAMRSPRCEFIKRAIAGKSCLNSIWITPLKPLNENKPLAIVTDIEGLPPCYVIISESPYNIDTAELIFPKI
jgi:hypothetical protein